MIRSFADKMKIKQEAFAAEQEVLAEQAEQTRIQNEEILFEQELLEEKARVNQLFAEDAYRKEQTYLREKEKRDAITRRRIEEWDAEADDRLAKIELSKKIIAEGKISSAERYIARSKQKQAPREKGRATDGMPMNAPSTWVLTWKSFSTHPDISNLPMSEKIRLFKLAETQQIDKLNYYSNLHSAENAIGTNDYWSDGIIDVKDFPPDASNTISSDVTWPNSVDINTPIIIAPGVTVTVLGILTINAAITNYGTFIVNGMLVENVSINNIENGRVLVS
jgi:hypothetical protein